MTTRNTAARDHIEMLRHDFHAPSRSFRVTIGRRLVNIGLRLSGEELRVVYPRASRPSGAYP